MFIQWGCNDDSDDNDHFNIFGAVLGVVGFHLLITSGGDPGPYTVGEAIMLGMFICEGTARLWEIPISRKGREPFR